MAPKIQLPSEHKQKQLSHALVLRGYCTTILKQEPLNLELLSGVKNQAEIIDIAKQLDRALIDAKDHARSYLDDLQPRLITDTVRLRSWLGLANAFPDSVASNTSDWKKGLAVLANETTVHSESALGCKQALETLRDHFLSDSQKFSELANKMDALVSGEKGALKNLEGELGALQTKINALIATTTLGFLAAAAGVLMMLVGALASPFTAGGTGVLIISGFMLTAGGAIGGGVSAGLLAEAYKTQRKKLEDQTRLNGAVRLLTGASTGLKSTAASGIAVADATADMAVAWSTMGSTLTAFKDHLTNESLMELRNYWCNTLRSDLLKLDEALKTNLVQLAGIELHAESAVAINEHPRFPVLIAA
jgi:hypothetical protein